MIRWIIGSFASLVAAGLGTFLVHRELSAGLPVVLPPPTSLSAMDLSGVTENRTAWTNQARFQILVMARPEFTAGLDVEARAEGQQFQGIPTATGKALGGCPSSAGCAADAAKAHSARLTLNSGRYHWQVRFHNGSGVSAWVRAPTDFWVDTGAPTTPQISSSTDPDPSKLYHTGSARFSWTSNDTLSGIAGFGYRLDKDPKGAPSLELRTAQPSVALTGLDTGSYFFHVRSRDNAGNWSAIASFPLRIDVTPPGLAHVRFSQFQFDPQYSPLTVSFSVTRPATRVHVGIYHQSDHRLVRLYDVQSLPKGRETSVSWDGLSGSRARVPPGAYEVFIRATDQYGHSTVRGWRDFVVNYRRIVVWLSQQKLTAFDGNQIVLTSLVTTGNRALPTPVGTFHVQGKFHPFTFKSPWPKSSPYYYPPSKTQWAMLFQEGGYFIHDAPWRSAFGPGTNGQIGKPGSNFTGTHGCVNVPPDVAQKLFAWASIGTTVQVVN